MEPNAADARAWHGKVVTAWGQRATQPIFAVVLLIIRGEDQRPSSNRLTTNASLPRPSGLALMKTRLLPSGAQSGKLSQQAVESAVTRRTSSPSARMSITRALVFVAR